MIDLYALTSPNVQKIFLMLEETGLEYRPIHVDVWKGEQFKPEFVKLNPNAKIPVIVDHDGPGGKPYTCFESGAILMYLAEKSGKFLPKDTGARYDAIQWLMLQMTGVGPMFGQLVHFKRFAPRATTIRWRAIRPRSSASTTCWNIGSGNRHISAAPTTRSPTSRHSRGRACTISRA